MNCPDVKIEELHFKDGRLDIATSHPVIAAFMEELLRFWHETNAENYLELTVASKATGPVNIMFQRTEGKTPAQVNVELKARLSLADSLIETARGVVAHHISYVRSEDTDKLLKFTRELECRLYNLRDALRVCDAALEGREGKDERCR
jgi:hypothetical protein